MNPEFEERRKIARDLWLQEMQLSIDKATRLLQLQFGINLLKRHIEHPNKPGYRRHDILEKIKLLEEEMKK